MNGKSKPTNVDKIVLVVSINIAEGMEFNILHIFSCNT